jgi:hypothetical protein
MKRVLLIICLALAGGSGAGLVAHPAIAAGLCVGSGPGCYPTIQAALNAAHDGDVLHVGPGTFAGGITITVSVSIVGAGAAATIIQGGGATPTAPVVRIGTFGAPSEPNVSIAGVTVTGGTNTSDSDAGNDAGGGIAVEPSASGPAGTITIRDSVITGNRVMPGATDGCGAGCSFSASAGGGISNFGTMTLINTMVSNNSVTVPTSGTVFNAARGGGILNGFSGTLTLVHAMVTGNSVAFSVANDSHVFAAGGGIESVGALTIHGSVISNNRLTGVGSNAATDAFLIGGGIDFDSTATIDGSQISGNSVTMTNVGGFVAAFSGGIQAEGSLVLAGSIVKDNQATATITSAQAPAGSVSQGTNGAMEIDGAATIRDTMFVGNSAVATAAGGDAAVGGGAIFNASADRVTITGSVITGNHAIATAAVGNAGIQGGGIVNFGQLTLRDTVVSGNTGSATAPHGSAEAVGAGIINTHLSESDAPPVTQLTLVDSAITNNRLTASGLTTTVQGAGLFNATGSGATLTLTNNVIAQNTPDQCFGC